MQFVYTFIWLIVLLLPQGATADPGNLAHKRVYFRVSGLVMESPDSELKYQPTSTGTTTQVFPKERVPNRTLEFDTGGGVSLAVGFTTDKWFRPEVEMIYRTYGLNSMKTPTGSLPADATFHLGSFMFNIPFHWVNSTPFTPYIGGGLGLAWQKGTINSLGDSNTVTATTGQILRLAPVSGEGTELAYQILAGVAYSVTPELDVVLGYRFIGTPDFEYQFTSLENRQHHLELGIRYFFSHEQNQSPHKRKAMKRRMRK